MMHPCRVSPGVLFTALLLFLLAHPAPAALPADLDKSYRVEVVLQIAPNRLLTDVFKQQLSRELNDLLQQAVGGLATIRVMTEHPLLQEAAERGLLPALAALKDAGPVKTLVVRVDFVEGQYYQIETAQRDGLTGLVSPVVRRARTADRPVVGKLAAELAWRDFGPVGTVLEAKDAERVKLAIRGGKLPGAEGLVRVGDVFAIAQATRTGGQAVPEAYLQVVEEPKDGIALCRLLVRYLDDASLLKPQPGTLGYRALKLNAIQDRLRLRIVDDQGQPLEGLRIEAARPSSQPARANQGLTDRDGRLESKGEFDRIALVWVVHNDVARRIPVAILDDRVAVLRVRIDAAAEEHAVLRIRKRGLNNQINGLLLVINQLFRELNELTREGKHDDALARAREGVRIIQRSLPDLKGELALLRGEVTRTLSGPERDRLLDDGGFRQLEKAFASLEEFVTAQQDLLKERARQQEAQAEILNLINQARLARDQANYEEAIPLYEKALARTGKQGKLAEELAAIRKGWSNVKGPMHQKARDFIYRTWAKAETVEQLRDHLEEIKQQVAVCQRQEDVLALTKFLVVYPDQVKRLEQFLRNQERASEEGVKRYEMFDAVAEELLKLHREVSEFVLGKSSGP